MSGIQSKQLFGQHYIDFMPSPGVARRHCTPAMQEWIATQVRIGLWVGVSLILLLVAGGESPWFPWVNFAAIALFSAIVLVAERRFRKEN